MKVMLSIKYTNYVEIFIVELEFGVGREQPITMKWDGERFDLFSACGCGNSIQHQKAQRIPATLLYMLN